MLTNAIQKQVKSHYCVAIKFAASKQAQTHLCSVF